MSYSYTVNGGTANTAGSPKIVVLGNGTKHFIYKIVETGASSTSEFALAGAPKFGTITYRKFFKSSGTATTIKPRLMADTGAATTTIDHIEEQDSTFTTATGPLIDITLGRYSLDSGSSGGMIYGRIAYDSGSDNAGTHEIVIIAGHES